MPVRSNVLGTLFTFHVLTFLSSTSVKTPNITVSNSLHYITLIDITGWRHLELVYYLEVLNFFNEMFLLY